MSAVGGAGLQGWLLAAALLLPWLLLAAIPLLRVSARGLLLPLAAVPALFAALLLPDGTALTAPLLPDCLAFGMDGIARVFLLPAALIWVVAGWMVAQLRPEQARSHTFGAFWLLALAGNLALILAQDLLDPVVGRKSLNQGCRRVGWQGQGSGIGGSSHSSR